MRYETNRWGNLFLLFALLFGAVVRFYPTILAAWPINDGGMFYTMIQEIRASGFLLPASTSYNQLNIPFAYPPLALYAGAAVNSIGVPTLEVLRWLPALVSTVSILAFYWLSLQVLGSNSTAAMSAVIYALMPRSFSWYVMGGGLSRSFGILFLLLTCGAAWRMFSRPSWVSVGLTILCGTGAVLSHPETALHALTGCLLIWLFRGRRRRGLFAAVATALGVIALAAPWWGMLLARHGLAPFISVLHTGGSGGPSLLSWLVFNFAQEPFATVLTALGLIGLAVQCVRRQWFLPVWTVVPFIVEPRSAPAIAVLPLAMLGAIGLTEFVFPGLASLQSTVAPVSQDWAHYLMSSRAVRIFTGVVLLYGFFAAVAYDLSLAGVAVPVGSRAAMQWIQQNTPGDARFVVLTGSNDAFADSTAEWFPTLTGRISVNTLQGREWLLGASFMPFLNDLNDLEACLDGGPSCVENWASAHGTAYRYIYIQEPAGRDASTSVLLAYQLRESADYQELYDKGGVVIFSHK